MRSAEEKLAAVQAFENRGERTTRSVAEELGVSPQLIYNWKKRIEDGESLERKTPGPAPKNKGVLERARALAHAELSRAQKPAAPQEINIKKAAVPTTATGDVQNEIAVLRRKNARLREKNELLRRMVLAILDAGGSD
jgi:transposase-like protein